MVLRSILLVCLLGVSARADFPELFNSEPISDESLMPADEAAARFELPDGFSATAFAAEPHVQNPIAMTWDSRGRLWIAENYTYADRNQRFQLGLRDRVVIFDNTRGDQFETRKVFTDNVQMLTGIEVGHDGVWLMCPPKLIFIPDRDHDDVPDNDGEVVLDGFTVAQQNYHNFANGLQFGPDGWLYGRCGGSCPGRIGLPGTPDDRRLAMEGGIWRYHPVRRDVEVLTAGTTNPWGHDWNEFGEMFFVNTVNGHLWHMIPGAHFTRPFTLDPNRRTYELIDFHADHWHFDTGEGWTKSRDGVANAYGGGHAHSGTMIYQADNWPADYRGKLFTLNLHGRRANQEHLERRGSGYAATHGDDCMLAADTWFRGMELSSGPDGAVFVIDWSDAGECHEHTGVHRTSGRIFKIEHRDAARGSGKLLDLRSWSQASLAASHKWRNDWYTRQARLELARRAAEGDDLSIAADSLRKMFDSAGENQRLAVQSLLTLDVIGAAEDAFLRQQWTHNHPQVRSWAIRLLTDQWQLDDPLGPVWVSDSRRQKTVDQARSLLPHLRRRAREDRSASVRLTLASTLQRLPVNLRTALAAELVAHDEDADDHNLPLMIWYGMIAVAQKDCGELVEVAAACRLPTTLRLIARCLAEEIENHPNAIDGLIAMATDRDTAFRTNVLTGIAEGLKGWQRAPRPPAWDELAVRVSPETVNLVRELSVVFGDGRAMDELRAIAGGDTDADAATRLAALESLIQSKPDDLRTICESLLTDSRMNVVAARGLSQFDDPKIGETLVSRYRNFRGPQRPQVISILVSRASFIKALLQAVGEGKIPRSDLSAFQVRQIHSLGDAELSSMVAEVWGEVRETPEAKHRQIESLKAALTDDALTAADKHKGRALFAKLCQNCHRLYGEGERVGPDLTGANRDNLDYLLSNMVDPSSVVDRDFRMTILLTEDDRILNGLVTAESERTLSLQTATEALTLDKRSIRSRKITEKSPMPDGLIDTLSAAQIRDLIAYLRHPSQVGLP